MKQQILVYGKCGGYVTIATFLGNQWWVTNKDEKLEPLYDDGEAGASLRRRPIRSA